MDDFVSKKGNPENEGKLTKRQVLKYAKDLSSLFHSEKENRQQLIEANSKLKTLSKDFNEAMGKLKTKEQLSLRLGRILDQSSDEIFIFDSESYCIQQVNFGAKKNLGFSLEELIEKPFFELIPGVDKINFKRIIQPLFDGEKSNLVFESTFQRKAGGTYPVEIRIHYSHAETDPVIVAVSQDITVRERAMKEIERLRCQLELENDYLREEVKSELAYGKIVGEGPALQKTLRQIEMVANTDAIVLIQGETGTGKELVARAIHEKSFRNKRPLVKVNCSAIPKDLFESEFFGHVQGAFSGAIRERAGRFQLANEGTLFLDEVSEIPLELQGKLLRVIQEGQFESVGEDITRQVDVRILAATNRDLKEEVRRGNFREDLFYRLSVIPIEISPLRERIEDIELLTEHFLNIAYKKYNRKRREIKTQEYEKLKSYHWPGNVRELNNVVERAVIISGGRYLNFDLNNFESGLTPEPNSSDNGQSLVEPIPFAEIDLKQLERKKILDALDKCNWKIYGPRGAAEILHLKPTTLAYRIKKFGIQKPLLTN